MSWVTLSSGFGGAEARAKPKFKIGDIVVDGSCNPDEFPVCVVYTDTDRTIGENSTAVIDIRAKTKGHALTKDLTIYTGPIYEKDGQRFVPSGENRPPKLDEYYLDRESNVICEGEHKYKNVYAVAGGAVDCRYRRILLPVLEVEPTVDPFLDGTRPITDEDLDSLPKIRCRFCACVDGKNGFVEGSVDGFIDLNNSYHFFHDGQTNFGYTNSSIAMKLRDGTVIWAENAKENIRVVL